MSTVRFYVLRHPDGSIASISREERSGGEWLSADHADIQAFLSQSHDTLSELDQSDASLVRVLEDLIDVLITKNVIRHTDLPAAAQSKLMQRKDMRSRLAGALQLLDQDNGII